MPSYTIFNAGQFSSAEPTVIPEGAASELANVTISNLVVKDKLWLQTLECRGHSEQKKEWKFN